MYISSRNLGHQLFCEANILASQEPILRQLLEDQVFSQVSPIRILTSILASRLVVVGVSLSSLQGLFFEALATNSKFDQQLIDDINAVKTRDPACLNILHILTNLKGLQALQTYRITNILWHQGRIELAHWLANLASLSFGVDIHPAARLR